MIIRQLLGIIFLYPVFQSLFKNVFLRSQKKDGLFRFFLHGLDFLLLSNLPSESKKNIYKKSFKLLFLESQHISSAVNNKSARPKFSRWGGAPQPFRVNKINSEKRLTH